MITYRAATVRFCAGGLVLAAALSVGRPAAGQEPDTTFVPSGDTVSLSFAWPAGLQGGVELTRVRIQGSALRGADTSALRTTYSLSTSEVEDGILVEVSDFTVPGLPEGDATQTGIALLSSFSPNYVLGRSGELLRVDGIEELLASMRTLLDSTFTDVEAPAMRETMNGMISEQSMLALLSQEWTGLIGAWVGAQLEVGSLYELETQEPLPLPGNPVVPFRYEFGVIDRVPCDEADATESCVELVMRSFPDPQFMKQFMVDFTESMRADVPGVPEMVFNDFSVFTETVVVTNPATLVPRTLRITQSVEGSITAEGVEEVTSQYRESYYVYSLSSGN